MCVSDISLMCSSWLSRNDSQQYYQTWGGMTLIPFSKMHTDIHHKFLCSILSMYVFLCICVYVFSCVYRAHVHIFSLRIFLYFGEKKPQLWFSLHTAYYCSDLTTKVVYSILDNIAMGWSDTGSERSVVMQDWGWERAGAWVVIVKASVRSCGLEQSVGGQRSAVYTWMSWTLGTNVAQSWRVEWLQQMAGEGAKV